MSSVTIRLEKKLLNEIDKRAQNLHLTRTTYIKKSIEYMNMDLQEKERKSKLIEASMRVRKESMLVNLEFSKVEYDTET